jgi:hypothetical protein
VKPPPNPSSSRIAEIITSRTASDPNDLIEGWQKLLKSLLSQMTPYLREGHLVTFRTLTDPERKFFEELHRRIEVPPSVSAIYISPSVRLEMMQRRPEGKTQPAADRSAEDPPDRGILLAGRPAEFEPIVNALFAKPPFTPAIDVYEKGRLLAGYAYHSIDECIADLTHVLQTHLRRQTGQG